MHCDTAADAIAFMLLAGLLAAVVLLGALRGLAWLLAGSSLLVLREAVAFTNACVGATIGADMDALDFHLDATAFAETGSYSLSVGSHFFTEILGSLYYVFGSSMLIGTTSSVIFFALSCLYLARIAAFLWPREDQLAVLIAYACFPASVIFLSVTLRESLEVLAMVGACYHGLAWRLEGRVWGIVPMLLFATVLALLHNGLLIFAPMLVLSLAFWPMSDGTEERAAGASVLRLGSAAALGLCAVAFISMAADVEGTPALNAIMSGDGAEYAAKYRMSEQGEGRAAYGLILDTSSPGSFAVTFPGVLLAFVLSPFPTQVRTGADLAAFAEAWARVALLAATLAERRRRRGRERAVMSMLLLLLAFSVCLWAAGTQNYGTGARHHLMHYWILCVLGAPAAQRALVAALRPREPEAAR